MLSFQAFTRFFIIIEAVWIIQTLSWLQFPILVGLRVLADITLPFLIIWAALKVTDQLYLTIFKALTSIKQGRRVMHLLKIRFQMADKALSPVLLAKESELNITGKK